MKPQPIDSLDRAIILATQAGLPLSTRPFLAVAEQLNLDEGEVITRMQRMQNEGIIRRISAVPNHYSLGFKANGMSVWNVPDELVTTYGPKIGALDFVSHCYHRPRHLPEWPYNLFAMLHAHDRETVTQHADVIAQLLGSHCQGYDILYSKRILKKTGLRLPLERT